MGYYTGGCLYLLVNNPFFNFVKMEYYQISVPLPESEEKVEILIAQLTMLGFESFEEQEHKFIGYIKTDDYNKQELLTNDYLASCESSATMEVELLEDKNWNEVWESNYPPVMIDTRCYIRAPFHKSLPDFDYEIEIKPKMAFGTGHHQTTSMILEYILENDFNTKRVLDMGCGSGVLSILASLRKAKELVAIDIDHWSYENTIENCEVNNITNVETLHGGAELIPSQGVFDIVLANINKNILLRDMKYYADALVNEGVLFTSGYYLRDLTDLKNCASEYGLMFVGYKKKNDWVAAEFKKTK